MDTIESRVLKFMASKRSRTEVAKIAASLNLTAKQVRGAIDRLRGRDIWNRKRPSPEHMP